MSRRRKQYHSTERWWKVPISLLLSSDAIGLVVLGLVDHNLGEEAIKLFFTVNNPDDICYALLLKSCAQVRTAEALQIGREIVARIPHIARRNAYVSANALNMFIACGDISSAAKWFAKMKRSVIDYGQLMKGFNEKKLPRNTLDLFKKMNDEGVQPNAIIYVLLLDACSQLGLESICQSIVEQMPTKVLDNVQVQNTLIDTWVRRLEEIPIVRLVFFE